MKLYFLSCGFLLTLVCGCSLLPKADYAQIRQVIDDLVDGK